MDEEKASAICLTSNMFSQLLDLLIQKHITHALLQESTANPFLFLLFKMIYKLSKQNL